VRLPPPAGLEQAALDRAALFEDPFHGQRPKLRCNAAPQLSLLSICVRLDPVRVNHASPPLSVRMAQITRCTTVNIVMAAIV
jgi:hypothetical protein